MAETEIVKIVLTKKEGVTEAMGFQRGPCLFAFTPLGTGNSDLFVYAGIPLKAIYAEAKRVLIRNLLALGGAGLLALVAAWLLGQYFLIGRTRTLVKTSQQLAGGDLAVRSGISYDDGEFGKLAQSFDEMAAALQQRQESLRESEEKYRTLVENVSLGITMIGVDYKIVMTNNGMGKIFGRPPQEFVGKYCFQEFEKRDDICPHCPGAKTMASGQPMEVDTIGVHKDGTFHYAHVRTFPAFDSQGNISGFVEVVEDTTARRLAEEQLAWEGTVNSSVAELSRALLASRSIEDISQLVLDSAIALTNSSLGYCGYLDPQTGDFIAPTLSREVWEVCKVPDKNVIFKKSAGLWGYGLEHRQAVLSNDLTTDPRSSGTPQGHIPIHKFVSVPAMLGGQLLGQLAVANAPRNYSAKDQEVCERLALIYALVIQRQRAEEAVRQSEARFRDITENLAEWIWEVDPEGKYIYSSPVVEQLLGYKPEEVLGQHFYDFFLPEEREESKQKAFALFDTKKPFRDLINRNRHKNGTIVWLSTSGVSVLDTQGNLLGYRGADIDITARKQGEQALEETGRQLQNLLAETEERTRTITLLHEMSDALQTCQVFEEAFKVIAHFAPKFFPHDPGSLYVFRNSKNLLMPVANWGVEPPPNGMFAPEECWAMRSGRVHVVDGAESGLVCGHIPDSYRGCYLCVPMMAQGESLGILHVRLGAANPGGSQDTPPAELVKSCQRLAMTIAENISLSLANLNLRETLRSQAIRDPLTGLFNRRYMEETLSRELHRIQRLGSSLGVIMMDLDHFKQFNDTYGHNAGDALLSAFGTLIQSQCRQEDIPCRFGGEEFLLILPGASLEVTEGRAQQLREGIKQLQVYHHGQLLQSTTLSLGVALFPDHGSNGEVIIGAADTALYRAKEEGRDRVVVVHELRGSPKTALAEDAAQ